MYTLIALLYLSSKSVSNAVIMSQLVIDLPLFMYLVHYFFSYFLWWASM